MITIRKNEACDLQLINVVVARGNVHFLLQTTIPNVTFTS